jgi:hypothetical protein
MSSNGFWSWLKDNRIPRTDDVLATAPTTAPEVCLFAVTPVASGVGPDSSEIRNTHEPAEDTPPEPRPRSAEICLFHDCDPMFCFCWD